MLLLYSEILETNHKLLLDRYLSLFPKTYQEKLLKYRRWQDAQLSLLGRLLIKEGLLQFGKEVDFERLKFTAYDKPYFQDENIQFNVSHSGELVVVVFTNEQIDIGVDIEKRYAIKAAKFKRQMTTHELERIFNSDQIQEEFFRYWTQKEAVLKATGRGLSIPLKSFEIIDNETHVEAQKFYVAEVAIEKEYTCYVCQDQKINKKEIIVKRVALQEFL